MYKERPMDGQLKPEPDEILVEHISAGNESAFEELVQRHQVKVINLIYYFLNDRWEAEDVAQEVFLKVWKNASKFKGKSKFSTWLYRIVINSCLNHKRSGKKDLNSQDSISSNPSDCLNNPELAGNTQSNPHQIMEKKERKIIVNQAIRLLPPKQRMALILSRFEGYSYTEISELMNVSIPSTESLLFRAKQNIAKILFPLKDKGEL
jgi:RNA polymerase sigma-70 factor (ECF subfamily)